LATVSGMVVLGCSAIRVVSKFSSVIRADLLMLASPFLSQRSYV
jgi:hypothetical protein